MEVDLVYVEVLDPVNFNDNFKTQKEFEEYLKKGNIEELNIILQSYSDAEMFELCIIIRDFINNIKK